jgi:hypothetical protein
VARELLYKSGMRWLVVAMLVATGCVSVGPVARVPHVDIYETSADTTDGDTELAAPPDVTFAAASDVKRWPGMFPDIRMVKITGHDGDDDLVTFVHADGERDNVRFRTGDHTIRFEDIGGRAEVWAEIHFSQGARPHTTHVHSRLYAKLHGVADWFISDESIRRLRQHRVTDDLVHLRAYFAR